MANKFVYTMEGDNKPRYIARANVSYYVIGWRTKVEVDLTFITNSSSDKLTRSVRFDASMISSRGE